MKFLDFVFPGNFRDSDEMEVNDANLQGLANYLKGTLGPDPKTIKESENFLFSIERNQNYPVLLLKLLTMGNVEVFVKQAAAVTFKNFVNRNWEVDAEDKIHEADRCVNDKTMTENMHFVNFLYFVPPNHSL